MTSRKKLRCVVHKEGNMGADVVPMVSHNYSEQMKINNSSMKIERGRPNKISRKVHKLAMESTNDPKYDKLE